MQDKPVKVYFLLFSLSNYLFLKKSAEKKTVVERAETDHCEASLILRKQARHGEKNLAEKTKAGNDVCKVRCGENKPDRLPRDSERASAEF